MDFFLSSFVSLIVFFGEPVFYTIVGLLIGWNVIPQPAMIKAGYDKVVAYVNSKFA